MIDNKPRTSFPSPALNCANVSINSQNITAKQNNDLYHWLESQYQMKTRLAQLKRMNSTHDIDTCIFELLSQIQAELELISPYKPKPYEQHNVRTRKKIAFVIIATLLICFSAITGILDMHSIIEVFCTLTKLAAPAKWLAITLNSICAFISSSITGVFDIYAIAESMQIPYLTSADRYTNVLHQCHDLIEINKQIKKSLNQLSRSIATCDITTIKTNFSIIQQKIDLCQHIQQHLDNTILNYEQETAASRRKKQICRFIWIFFTIPIYVGSTITTANSIMLLPIACACPTAAIIIFTSIWVAVEVYRLYSFERHSMNFGIDSFFFGSSDDTISQLHDKKEVLARKTKRNNEMQNDIKQQLQLHEAYTATMR